MNLLNRFLKRVAGYRPSSPQDEVRMGNEAAHLLRDGIFTKVIDDLRNDIIEGWVNSPIRDYEGQQHLRFMLKILDDMVRNIEAYYQTGQLAAKQIEDEEKRKRRK
jgi:hypothetical protein